jgi:hypothetical protein
MAWLVHVLLSAVVLAILSPGGTPVYLDPLDGITTLLAGIPVVMWAMWRSRLFVTDAEEKRPGQESGGLTVSGATEMEGWPNKLVYNMSRWEGFVKGIQGIWNLAARAESQIWLMVRATLAEKRAHPERDMNAWLASILRTRLGWRGRPDWWYYIITAPFSLRGNSAPVILQMYVLSKEDPEAIAAHVGPEKFSELMAPIGMSVTEPTFFSQWEVTNPWTAEHMPIVAESLREAYASDAFRDIALELKELGRLLSDDPQGAGARDDRA